MHKGKLITAGVVFTLVALWHLFRIVSPFPVVIGNTNVPEAASYVGFVLFGLLAGWMFCGLCCCRYCGCSNCHCDSKHCDTMKNRNGDLRDRNGNVDKM